MLGPWLRGLLSLFFLVSLSYGSLSPSEIPKPKAVDVVFVTDSAYTLRQTLYAFGNGLIPPYQSESQNLIRLAIVAQTGLTVLNQRFTNSSDTFKQYVNQQFAGGAATVPNLAILFARASELFNANYNTGELGYAFPREKFLVFLTTSSATSTPLSTTQEIARALKFQGVTVLVVDFYNTNTNLFNANYYTNLHNFMTLASDPITGNFFPVPRDPFQNERTGHVVVASVIARIRGDLGYTCSSFGAGHIVTFDGNYYDFQGLGTYDLVTMNNFDTFAEENGTVSIQVERGLCNSIFENGLNKKVTCNRGVAFETVGGIRLVIYADSEVGGTIPTVRIVSNDPYMSSSSPLPQQTLDMTSFYGNHDWAFFRTYGSHRNGAIVMRVEFFGLSNSHPAGPAVYLEIGNEGINIQMAAYAPVTGKTAGLCGRYDGNAANDFTNSRGEIIPSGTSDSELDKLFGSTFAVSRTNSFFFQRPTLPAGSLANPNIAFPPVDQTFANNWAGDYSGGGSGSCSNVPVSSASTSARSFLQDSCNRDGGAGFSSSNSAAFRMFNSLCMAYCETGTTVSSVITPADCETNFCIYRTAETRRDLFAAYNGDNKPPNQILTNNDGRILFRPTIDLGGRYDLQLITTDECGDEQKNVSVNIICAETPVVTINVDAPAVISRDLGGQGQVVLRASVTGSSLPLTYSWRVDHSALYINNLDTIEEQDPPSIWPNSNSKTIILGTWVPTSSITFPTTSSTPLYGGQYLVTVVVTDGCRVVQTSKLIDVPCGSCPVFPVLTSLDSQISTFRDGDWTQTVYDSIVVDDDKPTSILQQYKVDWDIFANERSPGPLELTLDDGYAKYYTIFIPGSKTPVVTTSTITRTGYNASVTTVNPTSPPNFLTRPIDNGNPRESFYFAKTTTTVNTYEVQTVNIVMTNTTIVPQTALCSLIAEGYEYPDCWFYPYGDFSFGPSSCEGFYNLSYKLWNNCSESIQYVDWEVRCTEVVARLKCPSTNMNYSFDGIGGYPKITLDASDTYDAYFGSNHEAQFLFEGLTENICGLGTIPCEIATTTSPTYDWFPTQQNSVRSGLGIVRVTASNGCKSSSDTVEILFHCDAEPQIKAIILSDNGQTTKFDYPTDSIIGSRFSGILSTYISPIAYGWELNLVTPKYSIIFPENGVTYYDNSGASDNNYPYIYPYLIPSNTVNTTINNIFPGTYELSLQFDGGCNMSKAILPLTVDCDNTITIGFHAAGTSVTSKAFTTQFGNNIVISTNTTTASSPNSPPIANFVRYVAAAYVYPTLPVGLMAPIRVSPGVGSNTESDLEIVTVSLPTTAHISLKPITVTYTVWMYDTKCNWAQDNYTVSFTCPPKTTTDFHPAVDSYPDTVYNSANPYGNTYYFSGTYTGQNYTGNAQMVMTWVTTPSNSVYRPGDVFYRGLRTQVFTPDVTGQFQIQIAYNDGCGDDFGAQTFTFNAACPTTGPFAPSSWSVSPVTASYSYDDQHTVRLEAVNIPQPAGPYSTSSYVAQWTIISAPEGSVYYPYDETVLYATNTTTYNTSDIVTSNYTVTTERYITSNYYRRTTRTVALDFIIDNSQSVYSTCFRPDVGGVYIAQLLIRLIGSSCETKSTSTVTVTCSAASPVLDSVKDQTVVVYREKPARVWLNATEVVDADTEKSTLVYNWRVIYPTASSRDKYNRPVPVPSIQSPLTMVASFAPKAGISYIIELSVSDRCNIVKKNITINTSCATILNLENKTIASTYDGVVPVQMMSFAYDYAHDISSLVAYPKCQQYSWTFVDYSTTYSDAFLNGGAEAFTKTAGFAGLISVVVIVAVIVPIIVWLYCTKKACFKNSGTSGA